VFLFCIINYVIFIFYNTYILYDIPEEFCGSFFKRLLCFMRLQRNKLIQDACALKQLMERMTTKDPVCSVTKIGSSELPRYSKPEV